MVSKLTKILFVCTLLWASACINRKEYPDEPQITFEKFEQTPDTAYLSFAFTDGDGDLGLNASDTTSPFHSKGSNFYNIYISYFEYKNGIAIEKKLASPFNYRFPRIESQSRSKALVGSIRIKIPRPYYNPILNVGDSVRYDFFIKDRDLHSSNTASSGAVVVKY